MAIFVLFGTGIYLGLFFNITALVSFSAIAAAGIMFTSPAQSFTDIARPLVILWMSLQGGYFVGLLARELTKGARIPPKMSPSNRI